MLNVLFVLLLVLPVLAGGLLVWEARTGRFGGPSWWGEGARAVVLLGGAIASTTLFVRTVPHALLLSLALIPIALLCLLRLSMLVRGWMRGWHVSLGLGLVFALGVSLCLRALPAGLDQRGLIEHVFELEQKGPAPHSIDPDAYRRVRV